MFEGTVRVFNSENLPMQNSYCVLEHYTLYSNIQRGLIFN